VEFVLGIIKKKKKPKKHHDLEPGIVLMAIIPDTCEAEIRRIVVWQLVRLCQPTSQV
jgi:hypothetical protein